MDDFRDVRGDPVLFTMLNNYGEQGCIQSVCKLSSALKLTCNPLTAAVGGSLMWNINVGLTFLGSFLATETGGNKPPTTCCILG